MATLFKERVGRRFGRLIIRNSLPNGKVECVCDCGNITIKAGSNVVRGFTRSCGCLNIELSKQRERTHGQSSKTAKTPAYVSWCGMIQRCTSPTNAAFANYGGRGITVCERWMSFEAFVQDMGPCPTGKSIDRINNNGNYEPGNCRWATDEVKET